MPTLNKLWETYGCEKCDNYKVLVLTVNFSDSKSSFKNNFIDKYGAKSVCIPKEDGGSTFNTALKNGNYGGPTYLIRPDKSVIGESWGSHHAKEQDIKNEGIKPHECGDLEAPKVTVTSPAASAKLEVGSVYRIKWTATDNVGVTSRAIRFSSNNGSTWTLVDSASGNTGTYEWTVPDEISKSCKIKVSAYDAAKNVGNKESGVFEIALPSSIVTNSELMSNSIKFKKVFNTFMVYIPFSGNYRVAVTDVSGKEITSLVTTGNSQWYTLEKPLASGMHIISIKTTEKTVVKKFWFIR